MVRVLICLTLFVAATVALRPKPYYHLEDAPELFEKFVRDYNRHYKSPEDRRVHYEAFVNTLRKINKSNANDPYAVFDINKFSDYTPEEWDYINGYRPRPQN